MHYNLYKEKIKIYGEIKNNDKIYKIISICDAGISCFYLKKKSMKKANTLKVKEYLAYGLPVISGHYDESLPKNFIYYKKLSLKNYDRWKKVLIKFKTYSRNKIRNKSYNYICKKKIIKNLIKNLK